MPKFLQKRRRRWYAILEIPKTLRQHFGRPRFVASLETESQTVAEKRVLDVVSKWKRLIELARHGHPDFEDELIQWREHQRNYQKQGISKEEIEEITFDTAVNLYPDRDRGMVLYDLTTGKRIFLQEHIDQYLAAQDLEPKTIDMKRRDLKLLADRFQFADAITKQELIVWVEETLIRQHGLSPATCRRIISTGRGYWAYLERHNNLALPFPFKGVVPAARRTKETVRDRRKGFAPEDYRRLLAASEGRDEQLGDLIRLGAYTGCRIEELCSLKLEQVRPDRFTIEDAKTEAGWRVVPIHSHIRQTVARLNDTSQDGYLLSGLTFNKYGDRSNAIGKRFGRLKSSLGYGADYVFHSFRKGVATQLEAAEVPENHVARLLGHDLKTMSYGVYSGGVPYELLQKAVHCLDW